MHTGQLGYKYRAYNLIQLFKSTYYSNTYQTNVLVSSPNSRGSVRTTRVPCTRHLPPPPSAAHYNSLLYHNSKTASLCYDPCVYQTASPLIYDFFSSFISKFTLIFSYFYILWRRARRHRDNPRPFQSLPRRILITTR